MDIATILGIVIALGSIIGGQVLEGGHVGSIMQLTAFIIVIGGTFGAICIHNPLPVVIKAFGALSIAISGPHIDNKETIKLILELAAASATMAPVGIWDSNKPEATTRMVFRILNSLLSANQG